MPLTDTVCKNARPKDKPYRKADGGGLYLEVVPNGGRYWRLKYRFLGKEKRLACGVYPETSLAEAREKRAVAKKMLADGIDPSSAKQDRRQLAEINAANTFEAEKRERLRPRARLRVRHLRRQSQYRNNQVSSLGLHCLCPALLS